MRIDSTPSIYDETWGQFLERKEDERDRWGVTYWYLLPGLMCTWEGEDHIVINTKDEYCIRIRNAKCNEDGCMRPPFNEVGSNSSYPA